MFGHVIMSSQGSQVEFLNPSAVNLSGGKHKNAKNFACKTIIPTEVFCKMRDVLNLFSARGLLVTLLAYPPY